MTMEQFSKNLSSGDGTIMSDVILFGSLGESDEDKLKLCRTYKIIKAYAGVAKRDLKLHPNSSKKRFHVMRSLYIANTLMDNEVPVKEEVQKIVDDMDVVDNEMLSKFIKETRERANKMLDDGELSHYNIDKTGDDLLDILLNTNNIGEFKY